MDWEKYSKELETIIDAIPMGEPRRKLVNFLITKAKKKCETK